MIEGAGRTLGYAALCLVIYAFAAACSSDDAGRSGICAALDDLGAEIVSFQERLRLPGIVAAGLRDANTELEARVVQVSAAALPEDDVDDIAATFRAAAQAVDDTVPLGLAQARPREPVEMAAAFILVELQPFVDAHARALEERC